MSVHDKQITITLAAGAGNGVTSNKQVSTERVNAVRVTFIVPASNTNGIRVGRSSFNEDTRLFSNPTDPLTNTTCVKLIPKGEQFTFEIDAWLLERGERYDLRKFWVQGDTANDVVQVICQKAIDK